MSQAKIHEMASGCKVEDRKVAAEALGSSFAILPDKSQGEQDLHRLTQDLNSSVRRKAVEALGSAFAHLPHKAQAEKDLVRLNQDQDNRVRRSAARTFSLLFALLPDKSQGWNDLLRLTQDRDRHVRRSAARTLDSAFVILLDKSQGERDLHRLAQDLNSSVRRWAAHALGSAFAHLPDKAQGWQDLLKLTQDHDIVVDWGTTQALGLAFSHLPDKAQGWQDLLKLNRKRVRRGEAKVLGSSFAHLPNKIQGWQDLHQLAQDPDGFVRLNAAEALGSAFSYLPDKAKGWQDLHQLAQDPDGFVRFNAANALGSAFSHLPDKAKGWQDLHRLAQDKDSYVRSRAARALGSSFALLPDKEQGWRFLHGLTQDQDSSVRMCAFHSLGKVTIYKASESNDRESIRSGLEAAVEFFERSSQERSFYFNPASFCRPFYRSYLALTFEGTSEAEVQRYLTEAKEAIGGSENKKELFSAVENLARALEEAQKLKERSREQIQSDLKAYQWYCDRAAEHLAAAEEKAPGAVKLLRKCNPFIEERIEATIAGIKKTAREICQITRESGTRYETPGARINQEAKSLSLEDPLKLFKSSTRIASILREFCSLLPRDKRGHACEIVDEIEVEQELYDRLSKIELALTYLQPNISLEAYESATTHKLDQIDKKLNTIIFDLSKIKLSSGDIIANLSAVRTQLTKIAEFEKSLSLSQSTSENPSPPNESQIALGNLIYARVLELEEILKTKTTKEDNQAILDKLESLKPSAAFEWLGRTSDLIAIFDAVMRLFRYLNDSGLL